MRPPRRCFILSMRNFKIIIEYDGTNYNGWQRQKNDEKFPTVQGKIELALEKIFRKKISVAGSGRTDTGVHALAQAASFKTETKIPLYKILRAVNTYLPFDISVKEIKEMPLSFNARFNAKKKWYRYTIYNHRIRPVLDRNYVTHFPCPLDVKLMKKAANMIKGKRNFSTIALREKKEKIREICKLTVTRHKDYVYIDAIGSGFLYKMVRRIAGLLIDVGRKKINIEDVKKVISGRKIETEIKTASAKGLVLMKVFYSAGQKGGIKRQIVTRNTVF